MPDAEAKAAGEPPTIRLADYLPPAFLVDQVELEFDLGVPETRVRSRIALRRNTEQDAPDGFLVLDGDEIELVSLAIDGNLVAASGYVLDQKHLTVKNVPDAFTAEIETVVRPADNTKLAGLYISGGNFCTQCEAEGFRRITFFPDRPDVMTTFRVTIRADKDTQPVLLSNGNLVAIRDLEDGRQEAVWEDPFKKPSYLFALVAGDLALVEDHFTTMSGREVRLCIYVEHGNEGRCGYAMDVLKRAMKWDEERFGREYDLDLFNIVAVSDFNMGAMENKSLNVFNARYVLADPEIATDHDYAGIETVVSHEYFHNWTGNRVTCRDWFQLSLKEGLTVFRDQEFAADQRSRSVKRIGDVRGLRAAQYPEDFGPLAHPVRPAEYIQINNFYTATVYQKGAEVIRMMHTLLGEDGFRKGMDLYFERHDGQAVTCDDFVQAMEDGGKKDLTQFRLWYSQAGTPELAVSGEYDEADLTYTLTVDQKVPDTPGQTGKQPMHMPLEVGLLGPDGTEMPLTVDRDSEAAPTSKMLEIRRETQSFRFVGVPAKPVLSLNRGFSAPVNLKTTYSDSDRAFLLAHDPDPFARWEAGQQYGAKVLLEMIAALREGREPEPDEALIDAIRTTLEDERQESAYIAHAVVLPTESYLAEQMVVVDVDAIHAARERMRRAIANALRGKWEDVYHGMRTNEAYSPDPEQAGRRALKNTALGYLAALDDDAARDLVTRQYHSADNMTDTMGALGVLNDLATPDRKHLLDEFYARYSGNPLVVEKWLALQAVSKLPDTLEVVRALMNHEAFSMRNPNKVRSLLGAYAMGNQLRFHAGDGSGFEFIAGRVIELDKLNPHVAARLLPPLGRWRRFDEGRQDKMKAALRQVLDAEDISTDVFEIASKSLGEAEEAGAAE
jgi:aminopeptidase N